MIISRRIRDIGFFSVLILLCLWMVQTSRKKPNATGLLDRLVLRVVAPVQGRVAASVHGLGDLWRRYVYLVGVAEENQHLAQRVVRLEEQLTLAQVEQQRLDRYARLLAFREHHGLEAIGARVVAQAQGRASLMLRIQHGGGDLRSGLAVLASDGAVGRIARTYGSYSDVILIVSPGTTVDAAVKPSGARGLFRCSEQGRRCELQYVLRETAVKAGDVVVTTGVGGVFPEGVPVAKVLWTVKRGNDLYQRVEVAPLVDFARLHEVLVLATGTPSATENSVDDGPTYEANP